MPRPIKIKIDVTKIDKALLFKGTKGTYLNLLAWPNKDGVGQYGDTHRIQQEVTKEQREQGIQGPYLGNMTMPDEDQPQQRTQRQSNDNHGWTARRGTSPAPAQQAANEEWSGNVMGEDDIPF